MAEDVLGTDLCMGDLVVFCIDEELKVGTINGIHLYSEDLWAIDVVTYHRDYTLYTMRQVQYTNVKRFLKIDEKEMLRHLKFRKKEFESDYKKYGYKVTH